MKSTLYTLTFFSLLAVTPGFSQTQFWSDTFEDSGAPSSGTRVPEVDAGAGISYFKRTDGVGLTLQGTSGVYTGIQGTKFWAGEDFDNPAELNNNQELQIQWNAINITGKTGLSFQGFFAAHNATNAWENTLYGNSQDDYIVVDYSINGGAFQNLLQFRGNDATNKRLTEDTDFNGLGDGTQLSKAFQNFNKNITGTGTTLVLRIRTYSNDPAEEFAWDNFRLLAITSLPVELSTFISQCEQEKEVVSWTSETEENLDYYELETSEDGLKFLPLEKIEAAGNSQAPLNYSFPIAESSSQQVYYRLKTVDLDGTVNLSDVISSQNCSNPEEQLLKSFSVKNSVLTCTFHSKELNYELMTAEGHAVSGKKNTLEQLQLPVASNLGQGMYLLRVSNAQQTKSQVYRIFVP